MRREWDSVKLARICLQLHTPLAIGSGAYDMLGEQACVLDVNDLPTIPGTSLAGALRQIMSQHAGSGTRHETQACVQRLFGSAADHARQPQAGRGQLQISFAHIHRANGQVVDGRQTLAELRALQQDAILAPLLGYVHPWRDQVRLDQCGKASDTGKFQRHIVPRGHRFSLELQLWYTRASPEQAEQAEQDWRALQQALQHPLLRLGGGSRSGLGAISVHSWHQADLCLSQEQGRRQFQACTAKLSVMPDFFQAQPIAAAPVVPPWKSLELEFCDYWRVGSGQERLHSGNAEDENRTDPQPDPQSEHQPDLLPLKQQCVHWLPSAPAHLQDMLYLPASGIKGALRHRSAYYLHCMQLSNPDQEQRAQEVERQLSQLFGAASDATQQEQTGRRGLVLLDDQYLPLPQLRGDGSTDRAGVLSHSSIDHYTGGVRDGALFAEEMLYTGHLHLHIYLAAGGETGVKTEVAAQTLRALELALEDLGGQRLALGAASARGHGYLQMKGA